MTCEGAELARTRRMGRIARRLLVDQGSTNHCTWRAHDNTRIFADDETAEFFLGLLAEHKEAHGILIRSYCLMGTHPHVVVTATQGQAAFSRFWQIVNQALAGYYNDKHNRCGQVVRERLKSPAIEPGGRHMLTVMRYGDLNPVRAKLVESAKEWKYSSYMHYAYGKQDPLIDDAPDYLALGDGPAVRRNAYRNLFGAQPLDPMLERRKDMVASPFIGTPQWIVDRMRALGGLPTPSG